MKKIDHDLLTVEKTFTIGKNEKFIVPDYQRAYSWQREDRCDEMWNDIQDFIAEKSDTNYFFGTVIINHIDASNDAETIYELNLVDGQQRMTTFMLLLKAFLLNINNCLTKITGTDPETKKIIQKLEARKKEILALLLKVSEDDVLEIMANSKKMSEFQIKYENRSMNEKYSGDMAIILKGETYDEIKIKVSIQYPRRKEINKYTTFFRNFDFFYEKIASLGDLNINTYAEKVIKSCQFIVIRSYNTEEAIQIFNSLNSKATPLTDSDIISAQLYSNCANTVEKEKFKDIWTNTIIELSEELSKDKVTNITEILNQYMYVKRAINNESDTTLPSLRRYFIGKDLHAEYLKKPLDFASDIGQIILIWLKNTVQTEGKSYILQTLLFKFNLNFKLFYIPYLFIRKSDTDTQKQQFANALLKLFLLLETAGYVYSSKQFKTFLFGLNMDIAKASISTSDIIEKINSHIATFKRTEIEDRIKTFNASGGLLFLNDILYAKEKKLPFDFVGKSYEIEHILCVSDKKTIDVKSFGFKDGAEFEEMKEFIGNKICLEGSINRSILRQGFDRKTPVYQKSSFPLAKKLSSSTETIWGKTQIEGATYFATKRICNYIFDKNNLI